MAKFLWGPKLPGLLKNFNIWKTTGYCDCIVCTAGINKNYFVGPGKSGKASGDILSFVMGDDYGG